MTIIEGKGQLTLVALFGNKSDMYPELWQLMQDLQEGVANILGNDKFEPYAEPCIHGTIIGLEGDRVGEVIFNRNVSQNLGQLRSMDLESAIEFLLSDNNVLPIEITIGGYKKSINYPFTSRGRHPYLRSFSIQGTIAVAMGWPQKSGLFTSGMDNIRRAFNKYNIYHKYHDSEDAYDNDFFFVLGNVSRGLDENAIASCETQMRDLLSKRGVPPIIISERQMMIVPYGEGDTTLENVSPLTLFEAKERIVELKRFYREMRGLRRVEIDDG